MSDFATGKWPALLHSVHLPLSQISPRYLCIRGVSVDKLCDFNAPRAGKGLTEGTKMQSRRLRRIFLIFQGGVMDVITEKDQFISSV